ncbi:hypothetical protein ERO13_D06G071900v2 [Gossypium hirsutum]|uniref:Uncharacterized protein isoform X2 n=1 Tax=Gossypium hirsutum TaxID=3635 RepID=A0ABM3ABS8_GOSHI|nr:uncharacterized protein LOC121203139 isoform X2 [Gossypium hirsutum]KAG4141369.1 hypothetical protein ERO13_D06G071900v2 [Gossypium hirsutum]
MDTIALNFDSLTLLSNLSTYPKSPFPQVRTPFISSTCRRISKPFISSTISTMAHTHSAQSPVIEQQRMIIPNKHGEKLVGLLHETESKEIVILCHGFKSTKDCNTLTNLAAALEKEGISVFRFDFAGNGESEGSFQYGNYYREADDLHAVLQHFSGENRVVSAILGHSKGGVEYRVTEEALMDSLRTDMHEACLKIDKECRVLTVHGSADEINSVEDALEFAKVIPNHQLHIIEGANHGYTSHQNELASTVVKFIKSALEQDEVSSK